MTPRTFDIVTFGEISLDTIVGTGGDPAGSLDLPGGQAATVAVGCQRLGWGARYIGSFGNDDAGRIVRNALKRENVDVLALARPGVPTRRASITIDPQTGDRSIVQHRDVRLNAAPDEIADEAFLRTRLLMVDATDIVTATRLASRARGAGIATLVDADHAGAGVRELLAFIDLIVLPAEVVPELSGERELAAGIRAIGTRTGARVVIATMGADGAIGWAPGSEHRTKANAVDVVDTIGAGDAFRVGVAAAWLGAPKGHPPTLQKLLQAGTMVAGLNCRARGAWTGLPRKKDFPAGPRGAV